MTKSILLSRNIIGGLLVAGISALSFNLFAQSVERKDDTVIIPELSSRAEAGRVAFEATCAKCHGLVVATDRGPPLVHNIYNPGHHGDLAFYRAVKTGTPQHHWQFGNMPPQPQVSDREIVQIISYIRALQVANGITTKPHRM